MTRTRFLFLPFQILPLIVDAASLSVHPAERRIRMINVDPAMDTIDNPPAFSSTAQLFSSPAVTCYLSEMKSRKILISMVKFMHSRDQVFANSKFV